MKKLGLHFRPEVVAEGWYPTAEVSLWPSQGWQGGLAPPFQGGEGERKRVVVAAMTFPCSSHLWLALRGREGKQTPLRWEDVGGYKTA